MPLKLLATLAACLFSATASAQYRNSVDLISLHYDHAPDKDDGHATVAGRVVTSYLSITPFVVSGAYGDNNKALYVSEAEQVMQITWGDKWQNAHADWNGSIANTAAAWLDALDKGGDIYVAEGGQSDFTADVVRYISEQSSFDTDRRINVIQHSLVNEKYANQNDLKYVKANTNYIKIDDGNSENTTADLHLPSSSFVDKARASYFSVQWNAAFDYLSPQRKLDFSDTVELLYILGIGKDQIADPDDFADLFITPDAPPQLSNDSTGDSTGKEPSSDTDSNQDSPQQPQVFPACSAETTDSDGDGYGWENNTSCVMANTDDNNQTSTTINAPSFPSCSDGILDTDGDGYGWENNQSCKAVSSSGNNDGKNLNVLVFPTCSSAALDEDGDGFGWENNTTCSTTNAQATGDNDVTTDNVPAGGTTFPNCSAEITDDNADGYGWENNQSCLITGNGTSSTSQNEPQATSAQQPIMLVDMPVCSDNVVDEDADGYSFENGTSCIMKSIHSSVTALITFPKCSTAVQDADNDGYGWESGASCIFSSEENDVKNQPSSNMTIVAFPSCSASVSDTDGDGYGWENNQTCTISTSTNSSTNNNTTTGYIFPTCTAEAENNADGYGWENNTTCIYPDSFPNPSLLQPMATCGQGTVDFDNDGYGWESGSSCVFR